MSDIAYELARRIVDEFPELSGADRSAASTSGIASPRWRNTLSPMRPRMRPTMANPACPRVTLHTRNSLLALIAARTSEPLGIVEQIVDTAIEEIIAATERGDEVKIEPLGRWWPVDVEPKNDGPPYRAVSFRSSRSWRRRLNIPQQEAAE